MKKNQLFSPPMGKIKKLLLMHLFTLILLLILLPGMAVTNAQDKIDVNVRNGNLTEVFNAIQRQTNYRFFYSTEDVSAFTAVEVQLKEAAVESVIQKALKGTGLTYVIVDDVVFIKKADITKLNVPQKSLTITGSVTDQSKAPLPGVTIRLKGVNMGVISGKDGRYSLTIPEQEGIVLIFSFVGMETQEIQFTGSEVMDVVMKESVQAVEEVIVTGYQSIRKSEMVGSTNTIKREELFFDGTNSLEQMLQGRLPGTLVMNTDGMVGTRQKVRVRGTSTLLGNQEPVWVVDGIIQEDPIPFELSEINSITTDNFDMIRNFIGNGIAWLNPNDIEDITVLKDASATVLYGVKAANGVIVIKTKRGEKGRISVSYSGGFSVSEKLNYKKMNLMNSKERIDVSREIYEKKLIVETPSSENVGYEYALKRYLNKQITFAEFNAEVKYLEAVNTDWIDILYRAPLSHNHSLSLSGGGENVTYYASIYANQNWGIAIGNDASQYGATLTMNSKLNEKINVGIRLSGSLSTRNGFYIANPYSYALETSRAIPCFTEDGKRSFHMKQGVNRGYRFNILNELDETGNTNDQRSFSMTANLDYTLLPGVRFESSFGLGSTNTVGESYASEYSFYIANIRRYDFGEFGIGTMEYRQSRLPHGGELNISESRNTAITWRNSLAYNKLYDRHRLGIMVGQEIRSSIYKEFTSTLYGYFPDRGRNITYPPTTIEYNGISSNDLYTHYMRSRITDRESNFLSYYGSVTYSYDERYVATGSIRSDASNRFGQDSRHRFLPVWSMGVRWNVHNEPWMKNQGILSELNFRGTYGWQGNVAENFGPDLIAQYPTNVANPYMGEYELKIKSLPYANLRWEKTKTVNLGVDLGMLKNRFTFSLEYYRKKTTDMIIYQEVPAAYGITSMPINGGNMLNQGIEFLLSGTLVRSNDFVWNLSLNTSKNTNKIESDLLRSDSWELAASGAMHKKGYAVSSFWVFELQGLDSQDGSPLFDIPTKEENINAAFDATEYMKYAGRLEPDFSGGISTVFRYKTFSLSGSFNLNIGGKKLLYKMFQGYSLPGAYTNMPKEFAGRWKKPGDELYTNIPSIPSNLYTDRNMYEPKWVLLPSANTVGHLYDMYNYSDARVVNASFFRCNNLSLSYNFTEKLLTYFQLKNLSITASVSNPFIIVSKDYKGMDPEVATGNQPISRNYSLGLNISF